MTLTLPVRYSNRGEQPPWRASYEIRNGGGQYYGTGATSFTFHNGG